MRWCAIKSISLKWLEFRHGCSLRLWTGPPPWAILGPSRLNRRPAGLPRSKACVRPAWFNGAPKIKIKSKARARRRIVGGAVRRFDLLPMAVCQLMYLVNGPPHSRASPLPHFELSTSGRCVYSANVGAGLPAMASWLPEHRGAASQRCGDPTSQLPQKSRALRCWQLNSVKIVGAACSRRRWVSYNS